MFESYFHELASLYLRPEQYLQLSPRKKKGADFVLFFDNAIVLLELKSALINIQAKQQNPDIELIGTYINRNIKEAYIQLHESEKEFENEKPIIKFILLYENLLNSSMIQLAILDIFQNDKCTYVTTIADIENFLVLYKNDSEKAESILTNLIMQRDDNCSDLQTELWKAEALTNHHTLEVINYYPSFMRMLEHELK